MKSITKHFNVGTWLLIVLLLLVGGAAARPTPQENPPTPQAVQSPSSTLFSYQGQLLDVNGDPVDGAAILEFALYDSDAPGGNLLWGPETHTDVPVSGGLFHVLLGSLTPIDPAELTGDVYLELTVNEEPLTPRERFTSVIDAVGAGTLAAGATTRGSLTLGGNLGLQSHHILNVDDITSGDEQNFHITNSYGNMRLRAADNLYFFIDTDNDTTDGVFWILKDNSDLGSPVVEIFKVEESGDIAAHGNLNMTGDQLHINSDGDPSTAQIKFQNNDYITYDDVTHSPGSFSFDADGGTANAFLLAGGLTTSGDAKVGNLLHVNSDSSGSTAQIKFQNDDYITYDDSTHSPGSFSFDVDGGAANAFLLAGGLVTSGDAEVGGSGFFGQSGVGEGGQINLREGSSGNAWSIDNYYGTFRLLHDGTSYFRVASDGETEVEGKLNVYGPDLFMQYAERGDGGRALVHMNGDTLVINYDGDFSGGVRMDSGLNMNGNTIANCGALVEANLQTEEELAAGRIDRFEEGDVLCWGVDQLELCSSANDRLVQAVADPQGRPIIIGAEVVKVIGPVQRGDILVASNVPGYAMVNNDPLPGSVIAQALEDFEGESGLVKAMIRKW